MKVEAQHLKKFLLDAGLVTEAQFEKAFEDSKKNSKEVGEVLVTSGLLPEDELIKISAHLLGIPFINLEKETVSVEILKIIPEPIARVHNIIAFAKKGNNLEVAMLDPEDLRTIDFIKKTDPSLKVLPRLTTAGFPGNFSIRAPAPGLWEWAEP